jgi:hypothetical protein
MPQEAKKETAMNKETATRHTKSASIHKSAHKGVDPIATVENVLPAGSWQRVTLGVAAAAGGGLLAAAIVGVGPAAIAGAAGYLAYRGLRGKEEESRSNGHKN